MIKFNHQNGSYMEFNNSNIYYEIKGREDGAPLLFLHGGMSNIESFNGLLKYFHHEFKCIGMDSRGHGASTFTNEFSYQTLCDDVEQLLYRLGIDRVSIIGHSDGGIVAMRLAESKPELVDSLVLIGAQYCLTDDDPAAKLYESITPEKWMSKFKDDFDYYNQLNKQPDFEKLITVVKKMWLDTSSKGYPGESIRKIACDTLIIRGDSDFLVSRAHAMELASLIDNSNFANIPFSSHSVHEEKPDVVSSLIIEFYKHRLFSQGQ